MRLTLATFVGYADHTLFLKPRTPQNIVIGGASERCRRYSAGRQSPVRCLPTLLLFLIIPAGPPHISGLGAVPHRDYARAGLPMLPVTHDRLTPA